MKNTRVLLQFAAGLFGGHWVAAAWLCAIVLSWAALAFGLLRPMSLLDAHRVHLEMGGFLASLTALTGVLLMTYVRNFSSRNALWKLAPHSERVTLRLCNAIIAVNVFVAIPAVMLRANAATTDRLHRVPGSLLWGDPPDLTRTFSFADVPGHAYVAEALLLASVAVFLLLFYRRSGLLIGTGSLPVYWTAAATTARSTWWFPFAGCVLIFAFEYVWRTWLSSRVESYLRSSINTSTKKPRTPWVTAWRQRKAARSHGEAGVDARLAALLALPSGAGAAVMSVCLAALYFAFLPNSAIEKAPGTWALGYVAWSFAYLSSMVLARPVALPLMRLALLPVGHRRTQFGEILLRVWWQEAYTKVLWASVVGLALRAVCGALGWPSFLQASAFSHGSIFTQWVVVPLAHIVGIVGLARSICVLTAASPRVLASVNGLTALPFATMLVLATTAFACKWLLEHNVEALADGSLGYLTFALVNGAFLPAFAWGVSRVYRYQWRTASLPAISSGMQIWSERLRKMSSALSDGRA
jgi:hypothetical protein